MKALRFELFTPTATFKTPFSIRGIETYPLPTYSTIIGLLYTALGRKWNGEFFQISISGSYDALFRDYLRFRKYNYDKKILEPLPLEVPRFYNFRVLVHIVAEDSMMEGFEKALKKPKIYLYLSGGEYPVKIKDVKTVELKEEEVEEVKLELNAYVPAEMVESKNIKIYPEGIFYRLPTFLDGNTIIRTHRYVDVYYFPKGAVIEKGKVKVDKDGGYPVWLLNST